MKTWIIKRTLLIATLILLLIPATESKAGGPSFRELQNIKLPFTPSVHRYSHTGDFKFFLCSDKANMLMLDGTNGKILWQKNFEKDFNNKKFSNQFWNKAANVVLVYDEDTKKGVATKYFIDGTTGKLLWTSDKYVSDFGKYELSDGFSNYFDYVTNGVLLPTKESVDLVDVNSGKIIWSKPFTLAGKAKEFDCFIMNYYDLVEIVTSKESVSYLTITDGKEVDDIDPFFNKKKYLSSRQHSQVIDIKDKNMYILMLGETNRGFSLFTGIDIPKRKMNFRAYDATTDKLLWSKNYVITYAMDWVNNVTQFIDMFYEEGKLFVEHNPNYKANTGLTVINPDNGELMWEGFYTASEIKTVGLNKNVLTPFPAPDPVTVNGKTYVVNKVKNFVSCYDANNGSKIWDSEKFPDAQKIPTFIVTDGLLIMGHGGDAKKCASIIQSKGPTINRYEYNSKDKYGIIAYDAATGKVVWSDETIKKLAKDKFSFIAGMCLVDGKLFCSTDRNFFILDPKTGGVLNSIPVGKEKMGDAWKMLYFAKEQKIILNCKNGIIKIDPIAVKVDGTLKTPNLPYFPASDYMNADDDYQDFAIFTSGKSETGVFKQFASIDLDRMSVRGLDDGSMMSGYTQHFSTGAEMFYKVDGRQLRIFSVK
jgi:outer membrane protein assembly factor BamB